MKTVKYSTSWIFAGGNPKKRFNTVKVIEIDGRTESISRVKSFATEKEARDYADKLNKEQI